MQQSPPLNASQTLADQHAIHTHNVNSFMLVLSNIPNDADPEYSYLEQKQKAYKLFSIYIMNGSHQNYLNTYDAINDAMDAFQAFNKSYLLPKAKSSDTPTPGNENNPQVMRNTCEPIKIPITEYYRSLWSKKMNTMKQYPERDPGQSLEDQHRIHTHNVKNFAAILVSTNDLEMVPIEYIAFKEKAFKALHLYMMFGSHENYNETCKVFIDFIDHHQMCFSEQKLQDLKDNEGKAVSADASAIGPECKTFPAQATDILAQIVELQKHVTNEKALFSKDTFELIEEARRKLVSVTNSILYDSRTRS